MTLSLGTESLDYANSTNKDPSHSATHMVCDIQCSQFAKNAVYRNFREGRMTFTSNMHTL